MMSKMMLSLEKSMIAVVYSGWVTNNLILSFVVI